VDLSGVGAPAPAGPRAGTVDPRDRAVVERQLGRPPRGEWRVQVRCPSNAPLVIAVAPRLEDGRRFPTAMWLTCPRVAGLVSDKESSGAAARWSARLVSDPELAERARAADAAYRTFRASLADDADPCASVGMAGQSDPLAVKCLHARVAAALCGIDDPVGLGVLSGIEGGGLGAGCDDARCEDRDAPPHSPASSPE
jgi:uncharacterized protein